MIRWSSDGEGTFKSDDGRHRITYYRMGPSLGLSVQLITDGVSREVICNVPDNEPARKAAVNQLRGMCYA